MINNGLSFPVVGDADTMAVSFDGETVRMPTMTLEKFMDIPFSVKESAMNKILQKYRRTIQEIEMTDDISMHIWGDSNQEVAQKCANELELQLNALISSGMADNKCLVSMFVNESDDEIHVPIQMPYVDYTNLSKAQVESVVKEITDKYLYKPNTPQLQQQMITELGLSLSVLVPLDNMTTELIQGDLPVELNMKFKTLPSLPKVQGFLNDTNASCGCCSETTDLMDDNYGPVSCPTCGTYFHPLCVIGSLSDAGLGDENLWVDAEWETSTQMLRDQGFVDPNCDELTKSGQCVCPVCSGDEVTYKDAALVALELVGISKADFLSIVSYLSTNGMISHSHVEDEGIKVLSDYVAERSNDYLEIIQQQAEELKALRDVNDKDS